MTSSAIWTPSQQRIANSNMQDFLLQANALAKQQVPTEERHNYQPLNNYQQLHQWSVAEPALFWSLVWQDSHLVPTLEKSIDDSKQLLQVFKTGKEFYDAQWFSSLAVNFAENLLQRRDDSIALISCGEPSLNQGQDRNISYQSLYVQVAKLAHSLKVMGIVQGDRVAAFMPNTQETVIAMLATTSIGAIWSSCSPDFGLQGVIDRFGQIEPKVLFTTDGYFYGGKTLDSLPKVEQICEQLNGLEQVVVIPHIYLGNTSKLELPLIENIAESITVQSWQAALNNDCEIIHFNRLPFDHPLYIMYSSGTTGVPKCIVHSAGGTLIQHAKELRLHTDVKSEDTIFYYSTCGWMMWNWLVSSLSIGATVVLYDGSPFYPNGHCLWKMAERHKVSIFGTSAKYLAALEKANIKPKQDYDLSALKTVLSTGSPLSHESFDYVYRDIKQDICLSSISGGTDIISCFALGNPVLPVYRGELQCLGLGMAVDIYDDEQQPLRQEKGELVCVQPFPSCPIRFWQDPDNTKFHQAYFDQFEHIWAHGDYAEITSKGGLIIHGRSDAVLNPGGVRIGTAEIYRQVEQLEQVVESIAIGQQWQDDVRVVLFVILQTGLVLDSDLEQLIRQQIRSHTTPRHVPAKILQVTDIPRTISGKIVELAVRKVIHNEVVKNTDALKNPEALDLYKNLPSLQV
jgi:acetoacetyl-CoA synthetase